MRRARARARRRARRARPRSRRRGGGDERVPRHPGVHPRARAVGGRARARPRRSTCSSCPGGRSVVGGARRAGDLARRARLVRRRGSARPVAAGRDDHALRVLPRRLDRPDAAQAFQPLLGCIPLQGGGGRSTVSARRRSPPGPPLEYRSRDRRRSARAHVQFAQRRVPQARQLVGALARARVPRRSSRRRSRTRRSCERSTAVRRQEGRRDRVVERRRSRPTRTRSSRSARSARRDASPRRGSCSRSLVVPLALAFALVARPPARALRGRVHEPRRCSRRCVERAARVAALGAARALPARARARGGGARAAAREACRCRRTSATVVLLVDVSGSMRANDVEADAARRGAARRCARSPTRLPKRFKVGLVSFSTEPGPARRSPTTDRHAVHEGIDLSRRRRARRSATGSASRCRSCKHARRRTRRRRKDGKVPGAIVLLSDGAQNRGVADAAAGRRRARATRASASSRSRSARTTERSAGRSAFGFGGGAVRRHGDVPRARPTR